MSMADPFGERFQLLRMRLQDLKYHQPIDVASAPLIEALLADLCSTNDQLSGIRAQGDGQSQELVETQSQMHPLRKENSRLLRENNQLHLELITSAEEAARAHKEVTEASRRVEKQNTDLRFAVAQQTERVRRAEEENAGLRARFDASLEQTGKVLPSGHEVKSGRARREHMEAHSPVAPLSLPPSAGVGLLKGSPGVVTDPLDADDDNAELLRLSEAQMNACSSASPRRRRSCRTSATSVTRRGRRWPRARPRWRAWPSCSRRGATSSRSRCSK